MARFTGLLGILAVLAAAWLGSTDRKHIRWRTIVWGLGLQIAFAFLVLRFHFGQRVMAWAGGIVTSMLSATFAGTRVLFGELGLPNAGAFGRVISPASGSIFAFQVLPTIIFISAFFAVLYHIGLMQIIIRGMAWVMLKTMRISGAESMNVAASIFMGQTEAPLTIRPFLSKATRSELMTIMTSGMAHVSGGIMAMYISQGVEARHLLSAVIMTSPGTILMAKMLVPETEVPATEGRVVIPKNEEHKEENLIGAIARGTIDGGKLAMNVAIMLISFLALVALARHAARMGPRRAAVVPAPASARSSALSFRPSPGSSACRGTMLTRSATCSARAWRSTRSSPTSASAHRRRHSRRAPSPSRLLRCAALPTSAPSACRSAALARWSPSAATTSRDWASAPCSPAPWPT